MRINACNIFQKHKFQLLPYVELKIASNFGKFGISESAEPQRVLSFSGDTYSVSKQLQQLRNGLKYCKLISRIEHQFDDPLKIYKYDV